MLRGYPFTLGLAMTLSMMCVLAPVMKLQTLVRRWASQHIPVVVDSEDYDDVLEQVQRVLATGGWRTDRRLASWMVRLPTRVLTLLAGRTLDAYVAKQLTTLRAERLEVVLHPSDLVLSGEEGDGRSRAKPAGGAARLRQGASHVDQGRSGARRLHAKPAPMPRASCGGGRIRIRRHAGALGPALDYVDSRLKEIDVTYEEWEVLFRQKLLLLVAARTRMCGGSEAGVTDGEASRRDVPPAAVEGYIQESQPLPPRRPRRGARGVDARSKPYRCWKWR